MPDLKGPVGSCERMDQEEKAREKKARARFQEEKTKLGTHKILIGDDRRLRSRCGRGRVI